MNACTHTSRALVLMAMGVAQFTSPSGELQAQETVVRSEERATGVRIQGEVIDHETREPLRTAAVSLGSGPGGTLGVGTRVTNEEGRFLFRSVPPGSYRLSVTLLGYERLVDTLQVTAGADLEMTLPLSVDPVRLEPIVVDVERRSRDLRGFEERSMNRPQIFTITREEMDVQRPRFLTDVLASVPGGRIGPAPYGGKTILLRGDCLPSVFIDRVRMPNTEGIDLLVSPNNVEAIEVFHAFDLPVEFGVNPCGGILIWTRVGERRESEDEANFWRRLASVAGILLLVIALTR